jgi:hypothetical protein
VRVGVHVGEVMRAKVTSVDSIEVLLPAVRELYSRRPETRHLLAWELQHVLWSLGYTDDLADESEIQVAIEVARRDWQGDSAA